MGQYSQETSGDIEVGRSGTNGTNFIPMSISRKISVSPNLWDGSGAADGSRRLRIEKQNRREACSSHFTSALFSRLKCLPGEEHRD